MSQAKTSDGAEARQSPGRGRDGRARGERERGERERERAATGESHSDVTQSAGIFDIQYSLDNKASITALVRSKDKTLIKLCYLKP